MTKLIAYYTVRTNWGYEITVEDSKTGEIIEEYTAGDSALDSQVYGTGDLSYNTL